MKPETKLKLRKWALMTLRSIVWSVDEWLHAQEIRLREDLEQLGSARGVVTSLPPKPRPQFGSGDGAASVTRAGELRAPAPIAILAEHAGQHAAGEGEAQCTFPVDSKDVPAARLRSRITFQQWEARRSGIAVISKKESRRRRGMPAHAFDLKFSQS